MLCFLDDGDGMDPCWFYLLISFFVKRSLEFSFFHHKGEVRQTMILGCSRKNIINDDLIGRYGNGLKS